ncbi:MAG: zinc-finger domain-containing protein [Pseudomonadota bacterium]|nr:zinc-finger domain-containing protein [Pseudomonadota bacterium]
MAERSEGSIDGNASGGAPEPETIAVDTDRVACNGGGGALGHPIVWYEMGDDDVVECKYCDRRFVLKGGTADKG